jgi:hypothetical protein
MKDTELSRIMGIPLQTIKEWKTTNNYRKDLYEFLKTLPEEFLKERLDMVKKMREVKL